MTRTHFASLCILVLVGCSRADAATSEDVIAMRSTPAAEPWTQRGERFALRACECPSPACADGVAAEFQVFRRRVELDGGDEHAMKRLAKRIRNCQAIVRADARAP